MKLTDLTIEDANNAQEYAETNSGYWLYYSGTTNMDGPDGPYDSYNDAEAAAVDQGLTSDEYYIVEFDPTRDDNHRFTFQ